MAKFRILPAASANGIMSSLDAPGRAARARGRPGRAIGIFVPASWDGTGAPPLGWTLPCGVLFEADGTRAAIVATDAFASGRPEFSGAVDELPLDWA